jgi:ribonuclease H2 subunit C
MAYLRGRKLEGKTVKLPAQCRGVVLQRRDDPKATAASNSTQEDNVIDLEAEEQGPETASMHVTAEFDDLVVWGHETTADAAGDPYVRSIEEWLQVSEKVLYLEVVRLLARLLISVRSTHTQRMMLGSTRSEDIPWFQNRK